MSNKDKNTSTAISTSTSGYDSTTGKYNTPPVDAEKPGLNLRNKRIAAEAEAAEKEKEISAETVVEVINPNDPAPEVKPNTDAKPKDYVAPVKPSDAYIAPHLEPAKLTGPSNPNVNPVKVESSEGQELTELQKIGESMKGIVEEYLNRIPKIDRAAVVKLTHGNSSIGGVEFHNNPENENEAAIVLFTPTGYHSFQKNEDPGEGVHAVRIPGEGFYDLGPGKDFLEGKVLPKTEAEMASSNTETQVDKVKLDEFVQAVAETSPEAKSEPVAEAVAETSHTFSNEDIENNPELKENGLKAGDEVSIPAVSESSGEDKKEDSKSETTSTSKKDKGKKK